MSGQEIGTVVGGIIGAYFGMPQLGAALGGLIGGALDPVKINGPHIGDGQAQTSTDGAPIAWIQGTALIAGTLIQVGPRREVKIQDSGKGGGPVVSHYEARQSFALLICESCQLRDSTMAGVVMILQDGKVVFDARNGSTTFRDSVKTIAGVDIMFGREPQMPHSTLEAITGVGNTPAYRGSMIAVFTDFNVTAAGDRIPAFQFVVTSKATTSSTDNMLSDLHQETDPTRDGGYQTAPGSYLDIGINVVGYYQDIPLGLATRTIFIENLEPWATYRYIIEPLYGEPVDKFAHIYTNDAQQLFTNALGALYDSGWWQYSGAPIDSRLVDWCAVHGVNEPSLSPGFVPAPGRIDVDTPFTGVRVIVGVFFGAYSAADVLTAQIKTADPATHAGDLFLEAGGYYSTSDVQIFRPSWLPPYGVPFIEPGAELLSDIVRKICVRGGLTVDDIDVSALAATNCLGYAIARELNGADALSPLLVTYLAFGSEFDGKLNFGYYGGDVAIEIDTADLMEASDANHGNIISNMRNQDTEFPRRLICSYVDPAQNYSTVTVTAERRAQTVKAIGDQQLSFPVTLDGTTAAQLADKAMKVLYARLEGTLEFSVPFAGTATYLKLCAGEPIAFQGKRYMLDEVILSSLYLKLTMHYDRQSAYTSNVQAIPGNDPIPPTSSDSGPTTVVPMNLPSLNPQDTHGLYVVCGPTNPALHDWRGCVVQLSLDGKASWTSVDTVINASVFGYFTVDEPLLGEPLTVKVVGGDLFSVTDAQLDARANGFAAITVDDTCEVCQVKTITDDGGGVFEMTDVRRGLLGTTQVPRLANERFAMLQYAIFIPIDISFALKTVYVRGVGFGQSAADADIVAIIYNPNLVVILNGGTVTT